MSIGMTSFFSNYRSISHIIASFATNYQIYVLNPVNPNQLIDQLASLRIDGTFNPYAECCTKYDRPYAPEIRRKQFVQILNCALHSDIDSMWIGRDLGYRGGRRTGLAFTDDRHLQLHGKRWGVQLHRPTKGDEVTERTAKVLWQVLNSCQKTVFLWNIFPLHPFKGDNPFSNRAHNGKERRMGTEILVELIDLLQPDKLLPIGNDAARVVEKISGSRKVVKVRHPSYGGQRKFCEQVAQYSLCNHD